ncbi:MAG: MBL fold metallo-hydrolase [Actinomycetota bacterium]|nr:MBL fold metallo-hydrolase [Actinomycetota bacterium]
MTNDALPLCEVWFEAERIDDDLFRIFEPHAGPLIQSNIWLVLGGERDLVVDSGNGLAPLRPFLQRLRPDPEKPLLAVATHAHMDHLGGLNEFEERLLHRADVEAVAAPDRLLFADEIWPGASEQMANAGYPLPGLGIQAVPHRNFDPRAFKPPGTTPTLLLDEGAVIDLDGRTFKVLHLPGHTPGSIGLLDESRGELFAGDAVYALDPLIDTAPTSDIPSFIATMKRLRELPVDIVHGGHDMSFGCELLIQRCDTYLAARGDPGRFIDPDGQ